jgi:hypothetical protein
MYTHYFVSYGDQPLFFALHADHRQGKENNNIWQISGAQEIKQEIDKYIQT